MVSSMDSRGSRLGGDHTGQHVAIVSMALPMGTVKLAAMP